MSTAVAEPNEYRYIRAYCKVMGWDDFDTQVTVLLAVETNAPADAVERQSGVWRTVNQLPQPVRQLVKRIAEDL